MLNCYPPPPGLRGTVHRPAPKVVRQGLSTYQDICSHTTMYKHPVMRTVCSTSGLAWIGQRLAAEWAEAVARCERKRGETRCNKTATDATAAASSCVISIILLCLGNADYSSNFVSEVSSWYGALRARSRPLWFTRQPPPVGS